MVYTTEQILAAKALNKNCGQECLDWALNMIENGYDDPSLYALVFMQAPFNHFEIAELRDRALNKLKISDISFSNALTVFATKIINKALSGKLELLLALYDLNELYIDNDYPDELYDFHRLYHAYNDLQDSEIQHYWDDATVDNIQQIIIEYFKKFIKT